MLRCLIYHQSQSSATRRAIRRTLETLLVYRHRPLAILQLPTAMLENDTHILHHAPRLVRARHLPWIRMSREDLPPIRIARGRHRHRRTRTSQGTMTGAKMTDTEKGIGIGETSIGLGHERTGPGTETETGAGGGKRIPVEGTRGSGANVRRQEIMTGRDSERKTDDMGVTAHEK